MAGALRGPGRVRAGGLPRTAVPAAHALARLPARTSRGRRRAAGDQAPVGDRDGQLTPVGRRARTGAAPVAHARTTTGPAARRRRRTAREPRLPPLLPARRDLPR